MKLFHRLWRDDNGQSMVEYGLILALIAIAVIVVLTTMGDNIKSIFTKTKATTDTVN